MHRLPLALIPLLLVSVIGCGKEEAPPTPPAPPAPAAAAPPAPVVAPMPPPQPQYIVIDDTPPEDPIDVPTKVDPNYLGLGAVRRATAQVDQSGARVIIDLATERQRPTAAVIAEIRGIREELAEVTVKRTNDRTPFQWRLDQSINGTVRLAELAYRIKVEEDGATTYVTDWLPLVPIR